MNLNITLLTDNLRVFNSRQNCRNNHKFKNFKVFYYQNFSYQFIIVEAILSINSAAIIHIFNLSPPRKMNTFEVIFEKRCVFLSAVSTFDILVKLILVFSKNKFYFHF